MTIYINHVAYHVQISTCLIDALQDYCAVNGLQLDEMVVAENDCLVPRSSWATVQLIDEQSYTVFSAVGGG